MPALPQSAPSSLSLPFVLGRLGYGPRPEDLAGGLTSERWLEEQLTVSGQTDSSEMTSRLAQARLQIKYGADSKGRWAAVDEMRSLSTLGQPIENLWPLLDAKNPRDGQEKARPREEVIAATLLRAVYDPYQVREVMSQFWHDHFHVNAYAGDQIAIALPAYDRGVIRKHALGNFREMLEAVACSAAMQYYLSNHSSRAGAANENYGRELFELHTLGAGAYLNDKYDRWRDVPGALAGHPQGYIDEDVYESARAFTGWTIEDGTRIDGQRSLPATGKFVYVEKWHDGYQKRVLATDFQPFAPPMADGRTVLDLVAGHPATSDHLAQKLCIRLIGPQVRPATVAAVADRWRQLSKAPDQIAQTVRYIAGTDDFAASPGAKVKRPLALMAGFVRATGMDFTPTQGLANQLSNAGQKLFGAPTPAGLSDKNEAFIGSNAMRQRWQLLLGLAHNNWNNGIISASAMLKAWGRNPGSATEATTQFIALFGGRADDRLVTAAMDGAGLTAFADPASEQSDKALAVAASIAAMSPAYQVC